MLKRYSLEIKEKVLFAGGELSGELSWWLGGTGGEGEEAGGLGEVFCGPSVHSRMPERSG